MVGHDLDSCVTVELDVGACNVDSSAGMDLVACEEGMIQEPYVEVDKRILSRRLSCNKQGYYAKMRDRFGPIRKPRSSTREGCKAMMLVKLNKSGKWVVSRFERDHTHPLIISGHPSHNVTDSKDRRIQELIMELERQDELCDLYREQIITFLNSVEEQTDQLSTKIQEVVNNVRALETEVQNEPHNR
ncbi:hypothetical protein U1Q18_033720 [Sarracenia purpurea var. burkii]